MWVVSLAPLSDPRNPTPRKKKNTTSQAPKTPKESKTKAIKKLYQKTIFWVSTPLIKERRCDLYSIQAPL